MQNIGMSSKLNSVCYEIRGPVLKHAKRMEEEGHKILKLNIGNPAPFGFDAPDEILAEPDSPTMAKVSLELRVKLIFLTASMIPSLVLKLTERLLTLRMARSDMIYPYQFKTLGED